jgi:hypothetical protein
VAHFGYLIVAKAESIQDVDSVVEIDQVLDAEISKHQGGLRGVRAYGFRCQWAVPLYDGIGLNSSMSGRAAQ